MANFLKLPNLNLAFSVVVIVNLKTLLGTAHQFISIARDALDISKPGAFEFFNSIHGILIDEENLNDQKYSTGNCDQYDTENKNRSSFLKFPNDCDGKLHFCWLHEETKKRKNAYINYYLTAASTNNRHNRVLHKRMSNSFNTLFHTGNICGCLCQRFYRDNSSPRDDILNSICLDPVLVRKGLVATGTRFKRYDNRIHLELQEGLLVNGTIDPSTVKWVVNKRCINSQQVVSNFDKDIYKGFKITVEDMILPERRVVTGVLLGVAIFGRDVDDHGNINTDGPVKIQISQCNDEIKTSDLVHGYPDLLPSTSEVPGNSTRGDSCKHHIEFGGTSFKSDRVQHIVPYIDMREVETTPPKALKGFSCFYRGNPGYGGFLSLRVFV